MKDERGRCSCRKGADCRAPGKHPCYERGTLEHGFNSATRAATTITGWYNGRFSSGTDLGVSLGTARVEGRRVAVVDVETAAGHGEGTDGPADLAALEAEHGKLPRTYTEGTANGGEHREYLLPEGFEPSINAHPAPGVELLVQGGMKVYPSTGYPVLSDAPREELPAGWVGLLTESEKKKPAPALGEKARQRTTSGHEPWEFVPEGQRNEAMVSFLSREHDGTRDLAALTASGQDYRERCFGNPESYPDDQIAREARNRFRKEPCRPRRKKDPEGSGLLERCSAWWYSELLPGGGKSKIRDVTRTCLRSAAKRGEARTVEVDGEEVRGLEFSESTRQIGEAVKISNVAAWKNLNRLMDAGVLVAVEKPTGMAWTFVLLPPEPALARKVNTPSQPLSSRGEKKVVGGVNPVRADKLTTPFYGWRNPVGNAGGGVEAAVEAFGEQTAEELAVRLGISRARDLQRRRLDPLTGMGVLVRRGDRWGLPEDHAGAVTRRMDEPYTTVTRRRRRKRTSEGRMVVWVDETVTTASENERDVARKAYHARERGEFVKMIQAKLHRIAVECFGGVDPETGEIVAERRYAPEPVEEAAGGLVEVPEVADASVAAGDALAGHECPQTGRTSELAEALAGWLERNPGDHPDHHSPEDFAARLSWLSGTLWAYDMVEGTRPDPLDVAAALGELGRTGIEEAA
jgi:putative DNA primase/helicase